MDLIIISLTKFFFNLNYKREGLLQMTLKKNCTAIILCGGKSSRMGFDKALLSVNNTYVLLETYQKLATIFESVVLVTDDCRKFPAVFSNCHMWEDEYSEQGPLGGIVTALEKMTTDFLFVTACDIPNISVKDISRLVSEAMDNDVVLFAKGEKYETLCARYSNRCLPIFKEQLDNNQYRIRANFDQLRLKVLAVSETNKLHNVNRPEELKLWQE